MLPAEVSVGGSRETWIPVHATVCVETAGSLHAQNPVWEMVQMQHGPDYNPPAAAAPRMQLEGLLRALFAIFMVIIAKPSLVWLHPVHTAK